MRPVNGGVVAASVEAEEADEIADAKNNQRDVRELMAQPLFDCHPDFLWIGLHLDLERFLGVA